MSISPYIMFDGNCREAVAFYQLRQEYTPFYNWVMNCHVFAY
jgi:hypothetical protein